MPIDAKTEHADLHNRFRALYRQYRREFFYDLKDNGWLHAFDPKAYPEPNKNSRGYFFDRYEDGEETSRKLDETALIAFLCKTLLESDPTQDKRYAPALFLWFRYGLKHGDLPEARAVLERYHQAIQLHGTIEPDPFRSRTFNQRPGIKKRPLPRDPLIAFENFYHLDQFLETLEWKKKTAVEFDTPQKNEIFRNGHFYLTNPDGEKEPERLELHLKNGAYYEIDVYSLRISDAYGRPCMTDRLLRDTPGLAEALFPVIRAEHERNSYSTSFQELLTLAPPDMAQNHFTPGALSEQFHASYKGLLERMPEIKKAAEKENAHGERRRHEGSRYDSLASHFFDLYPDLSRLARYKDERARVSPDFIGTLFEAALEHGAIGSARRIIPLVNTVPEWRPLLQAQRIAPVFTRLSVQLEDRQQLFVRQVFSSLMALVAKNPTLRDGSEAVYLPKAIDIILKNCDWPKLKAILSCATHPTDPVAAQWREAINRDTRQAIYTHRFDNAYKYHHIDLLMQRLDAFDTGTPLLFRLNNMPSSPEGVQAAQRAADNLRRRRQSRAQARRLTA